MKVFRLESSEINIYRKISKLYLRSRGNFLLQSIPTSCFKTCPCFSCIHFTVRYLLWHNLQMYLLATRNRKGFLRSILLFFDKGRGWLAALFNDFQFSNEGFHGTVDSNEMPLLIDILDRAVPKWLEGGWIYSSNE